MLSHRDDGFEVSPKLFALGSMSPNLRRLRAVAMPWLHELTARTGWATNLAILADGRALVVDEVYGRTSRSMPRMIGARLPLHATAIGKALLSGFSDDALDAFLEHTALRPYTQNTIVRGNLIAEQITRIRAAGVALSFEEWTLGTSGIAAPIYLDGRLEAALAVVGEPDDRVMQSHAQYVRIAGSRLSQALTPELGVRAA
jgi:DNA-binding IclR family transcriptional regulator